MKKKKGAEKSKSLPSNDNKSTNPDDLCKSFAEILIECTKKIGINSNPNAKQSLQKIAIFDSDQTFKSFLDASKKRLVILISVGSYYHYGEYLDAQIRLFQDILIAIQQFRSESPHYIIDSLFSDWDIQIVIADELQAYHMLNNSYPEHCEWNNEDEGKEKDFWNNIFPTLKNFKLHGKECIKNGEIWKSHAEPYFKRLNQAAKCTNNMSEIKVTYQYNHWKDIINKTKILIGSSSGCSNFDILVSDLESDFRKGYPTGSGLSVSRFSLRYLCEEIVVLHYVFNGLLFNESEAIDSIFHLYPGKIKPVYNIGLQLLKIHIQLRNIKTNDIKNKGLDCKFIDETDYKNRKSNDMFLGIFSGHPHQKIEDLECLQSILEKICMRRDLKQHIEGEECAQRILYKKDRMVARAFERQDYVIDMNVMYQIADKNVDATADRVLQDLVQKSNYQRCSLVDSRVEMLLIVRKSSTRVTDAKIGINDLLNDINKHSDQPFKALLLSDAQSGKTEVLRQLASRLSQVSENNKDTMVFYIPLRELTQNKSNNLSLPKIIYQLSLQETLKPGHTSSKKGYISKKELVSAIGRQLESNKTIFILDDYDAVSYKPKRNSPLDQRLKDIFEKYCIVISSGSVIPPISFNAYLQIDDLCHESIKIYINNYIVEKREDTDNAATSASIMAHLLERPELMSLARNIEHLSKLMPYLYKLIKAPFGDGLSLTLTTLYDKHVSHRLPECSDSHSQDVLSESFSAETQNNYQTDIEYIEKIAWECRKNNHCRISKEIRKAASHNKQLKRDENKKPLIRRYFLHIRLQEIDQKIVRLYKFPNRYILQYFVARYMARILINFESENEKTQKDILKEIGYIRENANIQKLILQLKRYRTDVEFRLRFLSGLVSQEEDSEPKNILWDALLVRRDLIPYAGYPHVVFLLKLLDESWSNKKIDEENGHLKSLMDNLFCLIKQLNKNKLPRLASARQSVIEMLKACPRIVKELQKCKIILLPESDASSLESLRPSSQYFGDVLEAVRDVDNDSRMVSWRQFFELVHSARESDMRRLKNLGKYEAELMLGFTRISASRDYSDVILNVIGICSGGDVSLGRVLFYFHFVRFALEHPSGAPLAKEMYAVMNTFQKSVYPLDKVVVNFFNELGRDIGELLNIRAKKRITNIIKELWKDYNLGYYRSSLSDQITCNKEVDDVRVVLNESGLEYFYRDSSKPEVASAQSLYFSLKVLKLKAVQFLSCLSDDSKITIPTLLKIVKALNEIPADPDMLDRFIDKIKVLINTALIIEGVSAKAISGIFYYLPHPKIILCGMIKSLASMDEGEKKEDLQLRISECIGYWIGITNSGRYNYDLCFIFEACSDKLTELTLETVETIHLVNYYFDVVPNKFLVPLSELIINHCYAVNDLLFIVNNNKDLVLDDNEATHIIGISSDDEKRRLKVLKKTLNEKSYKHFTTLAPHSNFFKTLETPSDNSIVINQNIYAESGAQVNNTTVINQDSTINANNGNIDNKKNCAIM